MNMLQLVKEGYNISHKKRRQVAFSLKDYSSSAILYVVIYDGPEKMSDGGAPVLALGLL
ncbi:hypothetical protein SAMN05192533_109100 [Mesobacillus persicus]|uniref:Uncharacterized protein n=1 Tax=Mesobacillus persicus TaxID=930146 RepID=A0A1H8DZ22_9BACI|nr:hypothetical protein SAMN05192533_109100 [Mesobacillus persicus]